MIMATESELQIEIKELITTSKKDFRDIFEKTRA